MRQIDTVTISRILSCYKNILKSVKRRTMSVLFPSFVYLKLNYSSVLHSVLQEVQTAAADAAKELADHEKQAVGLKERRKHAAGKLKKLEKTVKDVSILSQVSLNCILIYSRRKTLPGLWPSGLSKRAPTRWFLRRIS